MELGSTVLLERPIAIATNPEALVKLPVKAPPSAIFLQKRGFKPFLQNGLGSKPRIAGPRDIGQKSLEGTHKILVFQFE